LFLSICSVLMSYLAFAYGQMITQESYTQQINTLKENHAVEIAFFNQEMDSKDLFINQKNFLIEDLLSQKDNLYSEVNNLNSQVAGMSTEQSPHPFAIPSVGFLGHKAGTYGGDMYGSTHLGVDIWTSVTHGGAISTHRGNPVYSACDGVVDNFQLENGGVTILCDPIPEFYNVPVRESVRTYYGHLGNGATGELYIYVNYGQRVKKGQFIGYQGDLSSFTPEMRNVHLHFSTFTGIREKGGSLDPCLYIGGSCTEVGRFFINEAS
jgi:murein DD-endopeptidase MepM/ murein hydrolase activator NlpD